MNIGIFAITHPTLPRLTVRDGFATLDDAKAFARENFSVAYMADDDDTEHCADFITKTGAQLCIEPV